MSLSKMKAKIFQFLFLFLRSFPGILGAFLRSRLIKYTSTNSPKVYVGIDCDFEYYENIIFHNNIAIGHKSFFNAFMGKIILNSGVSFNTNVHINAANGGEINIGKNVLIGPNTVMRTASHNFQNIEVPIKHQGHIVGDILIEDNVWIAAGVIIVGGVKIGKGAVIGAGSVVVKDIPAMAVAVGVPAKVIKFRTQSS